MGQDYRISHTLVKNCAMDMNKHQCGSTAGNPPNNFFLSYIILCLENAQYTKQMPLDGACQSEVLKHRQALMSDYKMSPEVVLNCAQEIQQGCQQLQGPQKGGSTLHCLMQMASQIQRPNNPQDIRPPGDNAAGQQQPSTPPMNPKCFQSLRMLMKAANVGQNYK